jgi:lipoprotein NlpD
MKRLFLINLLIIFFTACANNPPAPVVNRSPQSSKTIASNNSNKNTAAIKGNDWRPDSYVVKKGDTLYSIGLNHGYDYREIAEANNIPEPYNISIGQKLSFSSLNNIETNAENKPESYENEDGVIVSPIDLDSNVDVTTSTTTPSSVVTPVLSSPKATREPFSLEAFNRKVTPVETTKTVTNIPPTTTKNPEPTSTEPSSNESTTTAPAQVSSSGWSWPTKGKVIATFNEATNKGLDIAGTKGQAIHASSAGKVIYAGADLRGYGKLVIIKHSNTFLSVYAHNSAILVKEGQSIQAGQKIAEMGDTDTNRVKLHFEIRERGKSVDPVKYLPQN